MASWVMQVMYAAGYAGIVFLMVLENVFPPIPSEVIMPLAGYMSAQDRLSLFGVIVAGTVGSVLGALPLYYLGRKIGGDRLKEFADNHGRWLTLSREDLDKAEQWFARHGGLAVLFCRLVPGIRSLISIPAGIQGMSLPLFLIYTTIGAALWTALLTFAGYELGANFRQVETYLDPASYVILAAIVVFYIWRVMKHKGQRAPVAEKGWRS
jgi:membrane protein DedA with SNARE-associated domain